MIGLGNGTVLIMFGGGRLIVELAVSRTEEMSFPVNKRGATLRAIVRFTGPFGDIGVNNPGNPGGHTPHFYRLPNRDTRQKQDWHGNFGDYFGIDHYRIDDHKRGDTTIAGYLSTYTGNSGFVDILIKFPGDCPIYRSGTVPLTLADFEIVVFKYQSVGMNIATVWELVNVAPLAFDDMKCFFEADYIGGIKGIEIKPVEGGEVGSLPPYSSQEGGERRDDLKGGEGEVAAGTCLALLHLNGVDCNGDG
jgi:hypothetical protein